MHKLVPNGHFFVPPSLKGTKYFDLRTFFAIIVYSPDPNVAPSLSEIGDLSYITSCLFLPGFLLALTLNRLDVVTTVLSCRESLRYFFHYQYSRAFKFNTESVEEEAAQIYVRQLVVTCLKLDCFTVCHLNNSV